MLQEHLPVLCSQTSYSMIRWQFPIGIKVRQHRLADPNLTGTVSTSSDSTSTTIYKHGGSRWLFHCMLLRSSISGYLYFAHCGWVLFPREILVQPCKLLCTRETWLILPDLEVWAYYKSGDSCQRVMI